MICLSKPRTPVSQFETNLGICYYLSSRPLHRNYNVRSIRRFVCGGGGTCYKYNTYSVDRIDSNQGYVPENIQFVSTAINLMKSTMSDLETKFLCKCIAENFFSDRTILSSDNQMSGAQAGN